MLFQITNSCNMMCPHCMDRCVPCNQNMTMETFDKAKEFAHLSGANVILISGGEPSHNTLFMHFARVCASEFMLVALLTNGEWLGGACEKEIVELLKSHLNVSIQFTNVKGLYRNYYDTESKIDTFKKVLRGNGLKHRMEVARRIESMLALGRATEHEEILQAARDDPNTMSCFSSALVSAQLPYKDAVNKLEDMGKFCHPLVDWQGNLHWSESVLCPSFANVSEPFEVVCEKAHGWRPCCKCEDFKKLVAKTDMKYVMARHILGIGMR